MPGRMGLGVGVAVLVRGGEKMWGERTGEGKLSLAALQLP